MHMKLSRLSSDMCTAHKISNLIYIYVLGILVCMHTVYSVLCYAVKNRLYQHHEWWIKRV